MEGGGVKGFLNNVKKTVLSCMKASLSSHDYDGASIPEVYIFFSEVFSNVAIIIIVYHDYSSGGRRELGRRLLQRLLSNKG